MPSQDSRGRVKSFHPDKKKSWGRKRKRPKKFLGYKDDPEPKRAKLSSSSKKVKEVTLEGCDSKNRIIDINILFPGLENLVCCNKCHKSVKFFESKVQGLAFSIDVKCNECGEIGSINSCKKVGVKSNANEVNRRSVLAARALGHGHAGLATFCGIMDLPKPVAPSAFNTIINKLSTVCEEVAQESMNEAVQEEIDATPSENAGLDISGDGSWRKRGFSSLQGIASVIGNKTGKVIDVVIKNSFCKPCASWNGKEDTSEYQEWYQEHEQHCFANHQGSAGQMEVEGIKEIFHRSQEKYGVKYANYIGDGDSKVFKAVSELKPYGDDPVVKKKECIDHVQKRMGTRLRNLKKSLGKQTLSDGKSIGGKGRLTGQVIDQLTSYYGKAIRSNCDSVQNMSNEIWATFYHKSSTDKHPQHHLCPKGANSWCQFQKAKAQKKLKNFHHKSSIPLAIMEKIKPIYEDLTDPELLVKCIGGYTQNNNESFNNSVWKLVPKTSFSGLSVLKIGAFIAVTCFNNGRSGFLKIMERFNIQPGQSVIEWVQTSDDSRLFHAERKVAANTMESRSTRKRTRENFR